MNLGGIDAYLDSTQLCALRVATQRFKVYIFAFYNRTRIPPSPICNVMLACQYSITVAVQVQVTPWKKEKVPPLNWNFEFKAGSEQF